MSCSRCWDTGFYPVMEPTPAVVMCGCPVGLLASAVLDDLAEQYNGYINPDGETPPPRMPARKRHWEKEGL